ncbi:Cerato-platanin-domain-containing protein, partial [Fomes fomentarius]
MSHTSRISAAQPRLLHVNNPQCGTCWQLSYGGKSIYVLAVDHAQEGWDIAHRAMNDLTHGQASQCVGLRPASLLSRAGGAVSEVVVMRGCMDRDAVESRYSMYVNDTMDSHHR